MEYYIYITKECNLNCSYCSNMPRRKNKSNTKSLREIADFILGDIKKEGHQNNNVVFYGGEPLLNQKFIKDFIKKTKGNDLTYLSFTNGTMLDRIDSYLLNELNALCVSIDGEHRIHDKFRGRGTYEKIIENMYKIRSKFKGQTIARLCFVPGSSIYSSVLSVVNWFDHVHWQIENNANKHENLDECLNDYSRDLDLLIAFWVNHLKEGIMKNIIPFQAITSSILFKRKCNNFRCGAGSKLMAIDTDGKCFVCDDLIGTKRFCVGDIWGGVNHGKIKEIGRNVFCRQCKIINICGGRCFRAWEEFPEKIPFYCTATNLLVNKLKKRVPEIKELIGKGIISKKELKNPVIEFTEQIP